MSPSILSDGPSVPIRGSKFVGMDSIRKLTTPGSVGTERVQEQSEKKREAKETKDIKEMKEKPRRGARSDERGCNPLPPSPPPRPLLPFLPCIAHLAQHYSLPRSRSPWHIRRPPLQRLPAQQRECESLLGVSRHAKLIRSA